MYFYSLHSMHRCLGYILRSSLDLQCEIKEVCNEEEIVSIWEQEWSNPRINKKNRKSFDARNLQILGESRIVLPQPGMMFFIVRKPNPVKTGTELHKSLHGNRDQHINLFWIYSRNHVRLRGPVSTTVFQLYPLKSFLTFNLGKRVSHMPTISHSSSPFIYGGKKNPQKSHFLKEWKMS